MGENRQIWLILPILKDHALLHGLVDLLKLLNVGLVGEDGLFVLPEAQQLVLEGALDAHADGGDSVHLLLDPRTDIVGLLGELATQHFIVYNAIRLIPRMQDKKFQLTLLFAKFSLQGSVALRHKLSDFGPLPGKLLKSREMLLN